MMWFLTIYLIIGFFLSTIIAIMESNVIEKHPERNIGFPTRIFSYLKLVIDWPIFMIELTFYKMFPKYFPYDNIDVSVRDKNEQDQE